MSNITPEIRQDLEHKFTLFTAKEKELKLIGCAIKELNAQIKLLREQRDKVMEQKKILVGVCKSELISLEHLLRVNNLEITDEETE